MYKKVSTDMDFVSREQEVLAFWKENHIFEKSCEHRAGGETFTFYDGPPTANGKPHIGHVLTRTFKDIVPRYRTMKGYHVLRKAGWDTHGLPVELEVEKSLGINGKPQIEAYGVEPFIQKCKESVWKYLSEWEVMSDRVGYWADMENPYVTYHNDYIESEWWSLRQLWDKGLIYHGHKVVPYCPRCGTALSSHEVAQGYKRVKETSVTVRFKVLGEDNTYILAWTTTPWTLPSNIALCMNANVTYVKVRHNDEYLILAEALADNVLGEGNYEIVERYRGSDLDGLHYEPLYDWAHADRERGYRVILDDYVSLEDGTGVVHNAPAFGEDDARVCQANHVPFLCLVDLQGRFTDDCEIARGKFVKDADPEIIEDLKNRGMLFAAIPFEHDYPFCWRCDTPLLYYARATWFVRMSSLRDELLKNNDSVNWMPDSIRTGRMGNFLANVIDWGLSRDRYWGTPLPIWECSCGYQHMVGSIAELKELGRDVPDDIELHKPFIDNVHLVCPKCGRDMKRVPEVIDCWYDSGSMPFAQWHYPFENKEIFEENFPADFISEAIDQTRGWFYTLMAISTLIFDRAPFKNCLVMGHVQDAEGKKMSKHLGNVVDPWDVLDKQGADAVRWYFYAAGSPWLPTRFSGDLVSEMQRKFMGTLWNTYAFFTMYASIDDYKPEVYRPEESDYTLMDKWALSKLNTLVKFVDEGLSELKITETARAIQDFVDELSNWYVRLSKQRFWGSEWTGDKKAAYDTLYTVLVTLSKLCAPYIPFMAESMYQNLVVGNLSGAEDSVHLCDFPSCDERRIDPELEASMEEVMDIVQLGRACRNAANIKVRQALGTLYVKGSELDSAFSALIRDELNVENVHFVTDARAFTTYQIKPQMRTLGAKYRSLLGKIGAHLKEVDGNAFVDQLERDGVVKFELEGVEVELGKDDCLISPAQKPGFVAESDSELTVVIDTNLTPELIEKGFVREVVSKLQTMRKEAGFDVVDRISAYYQTTEKLAGVIEKNAPAISSSVLATSLSEGAPEGGYQKEWNINGEKALLTIVKN